MRCSFFPGLASGLCTAKVIGLADSRESPDIYIHSRTDINPLRRHAHPAQTNSISGKIGIAGTAGPRFSKQHACSFHHAVSKSLVEY